MADKKMAVAKVDKMVNSKTSEKPEGTKKEKPLYPPKTGSVFPAKKRLVKSMVYDCLAKEFSVLCSPRSSSAGVDEPEVGNSCCFKTPEANKGNLIFPYPKNHRS